MVFVGIGNPAASFEAGRMGGRKGPEKSMSDRLMDLRAVFGVES
jgi:hypothetical protein